MNTTTKFDDVGAPGADVLNHYRYHLHKKYLYSPKITMYKPYVQTYFPQQGSLTQIDDGPQTVEQLLQDGYLSIPPWDPETAILEDRRHTSWLGLDDVVNQVSHRRQIYEQNMLDIKWAQCYAFNESARLGWPPLPKQMEIYQKLLQELHAEERAERVSAWRDIVKLRQLLPESIRQYLSSYRKSQILRESPGDWT